MVALLAIPVSILVGFTLDFGVTYAKRQALSSGADSAALAIVNQKRLLATANPLLYSTCLSLLATDPLSTGAKATAVTQINANSQYGETVAPSSVTAALSCQGSTLVADVTVDTTVPTSLGQLVGVSGLRANRSAQAVMKLGGKAECGLCMVGNADHDIQNGDVSITRRQRRLQRQRRLRSQRRGQRHHDGRHDEHRGHLGCSPSKGDWTPAPLQNQPSHR